MKASDIMNEREARYIARVSRTVQRKNYDLLTFTVIILAAFALSAFVHFYLEPKLPVAHAAEMIKDVHTREAACSYFELYPEKILDMKQYKKNCT